jgi:hypothetical protein
VKGGTVAVPARNRFRQRRLLPILMLAAALLTVGGSLPVAAAWPTERPPTTWPTVSTGQIRYYVQPEGLSTPATVEIEFGPVIDKALAEIGSVLGTSGPERLVVYAYSNSIRYTVAHRQIGEYQSPNQAAVADLAHNAILLDLPALLQLSPTLAENAIRNSVAHLLIEHVSGGLAPPAFAAGLALYVETPLTEYLARLAAALQTADQQNTVLPWFDLSRRPDALEPELFFAESYSIVAYLVARYDLAALRAFLAELQTGARWQDALRTAYGSEAAGIETSWRADLPRWTISGWRDNLLTAFDLSVAEGLLSQGNYLAAKATLEPSLNLYGQLNDPAGLARVQELVAQADVGVQVEALMVEIETALREHDYQRASNLLDQAELQYATLPAEQVPVALLTTYRQRATDGAVALARLANANRLSESWGNYREARAEAKAAGDAFSSLGDEQRMNEATSVLHRLDNRQRRLIGLMAGLGLLTFVWLVAWLRARGPTGLQWS